MPARRTPRAVRAAVPVTGPEKVLAGAELADGRWAVATTADLVVVTALPAADVVLRRPWCDVDKAAFDPHRSTIAVEWVDAAPTLGLPLVDAAATNLPAVVHERVLRSVVLADTVTVPTGTVKVAVRRDRDGSLFSQAVAGQGVDLADRTVTDVVDTTEARLREACGLPR
jgi:hypothetical protein